jgi:hypothetical protein
MANENLGSAKKAKNDEFYTQYIDVEKEINAYLDFDSNVFRGKTILLPCDDPEWSNFTKYFAQNFERLGLKKLISTSYAPNSKPPDLNQQPTLFEMESPHFDADKSVQNGKIFTLTQDVTGDNRVDVEDLEWSYLEGTGDFRSDEIRALRDEADFIITNPPFSLFREFLSWMLESKKLFAIIANMNAVTYKEVFPALMGNEMWLGATRFGVGFMYFEVPSTAPEKKGQKIEGDKLFQTIGNSTWFTNIDHGKRHQALILMSASDNIKFSKHKTVKGIGYQRYDNYDAIEVPAVDSIPSDYPGVMGVPITFLGKYNPEQFEIMGCTESEGRGFSNGIWDSTSTVKQPVVDGSRVYKRIFIQHKAGSK